MVATTRLLTFLAAFALLATGADLGHAAQPPPRRVNAYPTAMPTSGVKADGNAQAVRATAALLKKAVTKACGECDGKGTVSVKGGGGGFKRPEPKKCNPCDGDGRVPNDPDKITAAALAIVTAIVRMPPDATGADAALQDSYDAITTHVLKSRKNFSHMQEQSAGVLAQVKPPVDKMVLVKGIYMSETPHPARPKEAVHLLRLSGKKQLVAVVAPKQADPPRQWGRALLGGVVAGVVEVEMKGGATERVMLLERGFLIAPNLDTGWWNDE